MTGLLVAFLRIEVNPDDIALFWNIHYHSSRPLGPSQNSSGFSPV